MGIIAQAKQRGISLIQSQHSTGDRAKEQPVFYTEGGPEPEGKGE